MSNFTTTAFTDTALTSLNLESSPEVIAARVRSNLEIAPRVRRISLHAPKLLGSTLSGPDEFFGLIMPRPGQPLTMPDLHSAPNLRAAVAALPDHLRPELRWYTIRHFQPTEGVLSFDVVTHGAESAPNAQLGPGLRWCLNAQRGDEVGLWRAYPLWHRAQRKQLLVADPSAAPSVYAIGEFLKAFHPEQLADIHLVLTGEYAEDFEEPSCSNLKEHLGSVQVAYAPIPQQADVVIEYLRAQGSRFEVDYVWVAGEGQLCKQVRSFALGHLGLPATAIQWCPYWFLGRARP